MDRLFLESQKKTDDTKKTYWKKKYNGIIEKHKDIYNLE